MKYFFILGAVDPEMDHMQKLLQLQNLSFTFASKDGKRVNAGNAYQADNVDIPEGHIPVLIECEPINFNRLTDFKRIDHHRPGDHGYNLGADDFFEASSLGQLCSFLKIKPNQNELTLAAMDHCFVDAMLGKCEGVIPDDVFDLKVKNIASSLGKSEDEVKEHIHSWLEIINKETKIKKINDNKIVDLTKIDMGIGYSFHLLTAQVAAVMSGKSVLFKHKDSENSGYKITITGNNTELTIKYFMTEFAGMNKLERVYGVANRGYAGGYYSSHTKEPLVFSGENILPMN